ncbi:MAG: thiamine pyrophosphate-dependent enzyme [Lautropia sp.]
MVNAARSRPGMERRAAVAALLQERGDALVVTGLGSPSYDVHAAGDHHGNYYLWGAMGGAALVGLGLAQARPDRCVVVVTGDGEQLMGLGGLATIGVARPRNLKVVILDNGHYAETGMQRSHSGAGVSMEGVAAACGFAEARRISSLAEVAELARTLSQPADGPCFYALDTGLEMPARSLPVRDAVFIKNRLRAHLGLAPQ